MKLQVGALKCVINSMKLRMNRKISCNGETADYELHMDASDLQVDMQDCVPFPFPCRWLGEEGEGERGRSRIGGGRGWGKGRAFRGTIQPSPHLPAAISHF